jgi:hypothetical protein
VSWSEKKAREYIKRLHGSSLIIKVPDGKQVGFGCVSGLPDYLVVSGGKHFWYEVKFVRSENRFPLSALSDSQWVRFRQLLFSGVDVVVLCYTPSKCLYSFFFSRLLVCYGVGSSVLFSDLAPSSL